MKYIRTLTTAENNMAGGIWVMSPVILSASALSLIIARNSDYGLWPKAIFNLLIAGQAARHSGF